MKKIIVSAIIILIIFLALPYISSSVGWYGYGKWKYRGRTSSIKDSKSRKVFVKELNYKIIDSANFKNFQFKPYLERGFSYGKHSMEDTRIWSNSNFSYNISYERNLKDSIVLYFIQESIEKLDSSDVVWGYSKTPYLKDTLTLTIEGANNHYGSIKIW